MRVFDNPSLSIARRRELSQNIATPEFKYPGDAVKWLGAVQAQDYRAGLWGVGLRTQCATEQTIEQAIAEKKIIRTWPMRGTLHFVAPGDVRWMLKYLTPRIVSRGASRFRQLQLDEATFSRARKLITKSLEGGKHITRGALYTLLENHRISCADQRGIHILWRLAQEGLVCFGPREAKQPTFVLLEDWVLSSKILPQVETLAQFAKRYFTSHGPATIQDFTWWSGLTTAEARASLDAIKSRLVSEIIAGRTYWLSEDTPSPNRVKSSANLLPAFDEYLVGYKDRSAAIDRRFVKHMHPGGGILNPTVVIDGRIVATWKRAINRDRVEVRVSPFCRLSRKQRDVIKNAAELYAKFLEKNVEIAFEK